MTREEIHAKFEEIYTSKNKDGKSTGKNFITHMIHAYYPWGIGQRVFDKPEKEMVCAITGAKLFAIGEVFDAIGNPENADLFKKSLMYISNPAENEKPVNFFKETLGNREIALIGKDTTKYLCVEAYQEFAAWLSHKVLMGDKHIYWVMNDIMKKTAIKQMREKLPEAVDQKKIDTLEEATFRKNKKAKLSLGDLDSLKQLSEKLKEKENNDSL